MRTTRLLGTTVAVLALSLSLAGRASAQVGEQIHAYDVAIEVSGDGSMLVTERIDYDFGSSAHHGILRDVPTLFHYDDTYDREIPIEVVSVRVTDAPAGYEVNDIGDGRTEIKVGDANVTVSGRHTYTIVFRVRGALNAFEDHDELYWNAIGSGWQIPIENIRLTVTGPGAATKVACFAGLERSSLGCGSAKISKGGAGVFTQPSLQPYEGVTVVVGYPTGLIVPAPTPILVERWSLARAFSLTPATWAGTGGVLALGLGLFGWLLWTRGRDRRYVGSDIDQVLGNPTGQEQTVPVGEGGAAAPVEFAPPEGILPGQIGTLIDQRADTLDVTATIVDLAVRKNLLIEEIPKEGWFGKPDWKLVRLEAPGDQLIAYERKLLNELFGTHQEVQLSELRQTFHDRLVKVEQAMYTDMMHRKWFRARPDKVRAAWHARGWALTAAGAGLTYVLARWTHAGLVGVAVLVSGIAFAFGSRWMPARTAAGTAMLRRVRGFRTVIEKAETHMSRWAEEENVFTRYLPYAIVFGCTEKWANTFASLGDEAQDMSWYRSPNPFQMATFGRAIDSFTVTTGGTIASTPAGSGGSGFSGGGFSGGGGGGGGGGSW